VVARQHFAHQGLQFVLGGCGRAMAQFDGGEGDVAEAAVGHADHARVEDGRVGQ
jgi:hypothetical protein